jgi:superfamily II DNA or RNA helicase
MDSLLNEVVERCSCWDDFRDRLASQSEKQKGDRFEELVKTYLLLDPEYATKLKCVWLHRDVPSRVRKKLRLPSVDKGIDLIAQTNAGEYWAVQCKYRQDTDHSLPWREIATFTGLAFGVCRGISFGLVCSTTERITHVLKKQDRIGFCALDVWQGLDVEFFERLRAMLGHKPEVLKPLKSRPHQLAAIRDARAHFVTDKKRRGKLIMPCGTGKSLAAYWIAQEFGARRILVAVPSLALIRQTLRVWLRESMAKRQAVEWICVCSDESAGHMDRDDIVVLRQDLGVPCVTDPAEIAKWLGRAKDGLTVVFATYQSGEAIAKAARRAKVRFDLGIMDEAHKTVGARDKLFSHLLHDENLPIRRRIFMTATERRYQGASDEILSMDDAAMYGDTFHLLSFKRALEYTPPILSDYKIITILVSRDEVAELIRKNVAVRPDKGRWDREIGAEMLAALIALRKAMRKHPIRHAVSFHSSISKAEVFKVHNDAFTKAFPDYGAVETFHVSGKTPTGTRARIVKEFAETKCGIISNARCLTEGVDVPGIDCVMFADPRRSAVDIVQAVGRALRISAGKKMGYVIVPILHDANAAAPDILESEEFKEVLTTLRALAANDDRIIEYFRAVSEGKSKAGRGSVELELDERLAKRIDLAAFTREIELKCWDRLAKLSWRPFEEAREFARGLGLKNVAEWGSFCTGRLLGKGRLPQDIPAGPGRTYKDKGWQGYGDWLGTGTVAPRLRKYRSFHEARTFVHELELKSCGEWLAFCKGKLSQKGMLPRDIPGNPSRTYSGKGWQGMGDWLGTGNIANFRRVYRPFRKARAFARNLNLTSQNEWGLFCAGKLPRKGRLPTDIPSNPNNTYADKGWKGMGDWLGTGRVADHLKVYRSFEEARTFVHRLKLKSESEWRLFRKGGMPLKGKRPSDIPSNPNQTYADKGWKGMGDWLGTGTIAPRLRKYRHFGEGRAFVRRLKLKSGSEWRAFCRGEMPRQGKLPLDIPANPSRTYAGKGWKGMGDWLGTGRIADHLKGYRPFAEARTFVHTLKLKSESEWRAFCLGQMPRKGERPPDIPAIPHRTYADKGWKGMGDWLGTGTVATQRRHYRSFSKARDFVRRLGLKTGVEWSAFCARRLHRRDELPADIPSGPARVYADKGWKGMGDWLGTGTVAPQLRKYRQFRNARAFARTLDLKTAKEWYAFCKTTRSSKGSLPSDIPAAPDYVYADQGWQSWGDWLGTERNRSCIEQK